MQQIRLGAISTALLATTSLTPAHAEVFNRISTFNVVENLPADADPAEGTVSEIIAVTEEEAYEWAVRSAKNKPGALPPAGEQCSARALLDRY